jgi:hypothetical protein
MTCAKWLVYLYLHYSRQDVFRPSARYRRGLDIGFQTGSRAARALTRAAAFCWGIAGSRRYRGILSKLPEDRAHVEILANDSQADNGSEWTSADMAANGQPLLTRAR